MWEAWEIRVVPSVLFFENGKVARRLDGRPGVGLAVADLERALVDFG